ncbi:spore gernimation protein KA [Paenibacillus beijingensis]|uniref:Spore gernimation protein KA n=1 Tax=Paenibacillus beijingensis TaxID=1126833 RepID=A0A0D5NRK4_9BACL|nr:spore gernimation protein KA [Paenibacillus beijingensis]
MKFFYQKQNAQDDPGEGTESPEPVACSLQQNLDTIKKLTGSSSDIIIRKVQRNHSLQMAVVYIEGLTDNAIINQHILNPIINGEQDISVYADSSPDSFPVIQNQVIPIGGTNKVQDIKAIIAALFNGFAVILAEGWNEGLSAAASKRMQRGVEEPTSQTVIRGPKEGFTENIGTNVALLRHRIKSPKLWKIDRTIGTLTQTSVSVMYIEGVATESVLKEVLQRLDGIKTDSILEGGYLEEFIQDHTFTPFPTIINTERPDSAAAALLEGQVIVLVDGSPFVLILPITFFKFFIASEDYYQRFDISTFLRLIRFASFALSMLLPSLYVAVTTFHQEMLPSTLLYSLAVQREGVPLPALFEAILMELTFEILREAGIRMPRAIGPAISIVGALVLGQAAVQAGLVSAAMVIVVALTAISNFVVPQFNMAIAARLLRFVLMLSAGTLGLFGIMSCLIFLLIHMASLRSFGIPYMTPVAPMIPANMKDIFVRVPWWMMSTRPKLFAPKNNVRQSANLRPTHKKRND